MQENELAAARLEAEKQAESIEPKIEVNTEALNELHKRFEGISLDDAKRIILEVTNDLLADLKVVYLTYDESSLFISR